MRLSAPLVLAVLGHLLFWGWNLSFLALVTFGLGPTVIGPMGVAASVGMIPWHFVAFGLLLTAIPPAAMALGLWKLRSDPGRLLSMFYGVQAPLMLVCLIRLFAVQVLTAPTALALGVVVVGAATLLRTLLHGPDERSTPILVARLAGASAWAVACAWTAALLGLYAVPVGLLGASALVEGGLGLLSHPGTLLEAPALLPVVVAWLAFAAFTLVALVVYPAAMIGVGARGWQLVHRRARARIGDRAALAVTGASAAALVGAFAVLGRQPQAAAFERLTVATDADRRAALLASDGIRAGLLSARLAPERTFEGDPDGEHVRDLWREILGSAGAEPPRLAWMALMWPFVYHPVGEGWTHDDDVRGWSGTPADVQAASRAYAAFFDAPIEIAERDALLHAARQTWSVEAAHAGLLDVGGRKVRLAGQEITVAPRGDLATIMIHDTYRNQGWDPQEVLVAFALPESAAVTGLWLGTSPDRADAFTHVLAPRGAAQEVYESEVRVRRDPALLEAVGPGQYRLRAFPVPPREGSVHDPSTITDEGPDLHLWLELVVPAVGGAYPLPAVAELRNLYLDDAGPRMLDGVNFTGSGWVPDGVPATAPRAAHSVRVAGFDVDAVPAAPATPAPSGHVAVLIDGTRSMDARRADVAAALATLRASATRLDVWCVVEDRVTACPGYDPATALAWGAVALESRLVEVAGHVAGADELVVLTDAGSYELAAEAEAAGLPDVALPRLWLVHLGGLPKAWPDWTLDRIQRTGGGAVTTAEDWLQRRAAPDVVDGWRWTVRPADPSRTPDPDPVFAKLAARRAVAVLDAERRTSGLADLDALHAVAAEAGVVTAYSSMLVLVDDAQRRKLADAEARGNRFDREVIDGVADAPVVTSVPEPEVWALLAVGAALAAARRRHPYRPTPDMGQGLSQDVAGPGPRDVRTYSEK